MKSKLYKHRRGKECISTQASFVPHLCLREKGDNLGPLIRITLAEMISGNTIDKRIVAESVYNRWLRGTDKELTQANNEVTSLKEVIEARNGGTYNASRKNSYKKMDIYLEEEFIKSPEYWSENKR